MDLEEQLAIVRLLQNEDISFVEQGIFLWETLITDALSFHSDLLMMTKWEESELALDFDTHFQRFSVFPHQAYLALWSWAKLYSFPELRKRISLTMELSAINRELEQLPENIGELEYLEVLKLSFNQLKDLPESFGSLKNLQELDLGFNQFTELPEVVGELGKLQTLQLMNNQIRKLPETIGKLESLTVLSLAGNQLHELPSTISGCRNLSSLELGGNGLLRVPKNIETIPNLQKLFLGSNQLKDIPEKLSKLENLELIYLRYNQFSSFPDALEKLPNLKRVDLVGNLIDKNDPVETRKLDKYKEYASLWDQVKIWHIIVLSILFWAYLFLG